MALERGYCDCKRRTTHKNAEGKYFCIICEQQTLLKMGIEDKFKDDAKGRQKTITTLLDKSNLTLQEIKSLLTSQKPKIYIPVEVNKTKICYGVISDTHIGHKCYDSKLMDRAALEFKKRKVDFIIHGGDILEGHYESKRAGSVFELEHIGGDEQVKRAIKELKKIDTKTPIYAVVGNHEHNTFGKMSGFDIGERLAENLPNFTNLGTQHGYVDLPFGKQIQIIHPDGGTAYALSYKVQKIAESLESGKKPNILHVGHFHKAEYLFYRNIHIIQNGCFESQTPFMKNNHISAHKGFWIVTADISKNGVERIVPEFFPCYE